MGYLLDVARNGFKPLNGSEWGSDEAKKEVDEKISRLMLVKPHFDDDTYPRWSAEVFAIRKLRETTPKLQPEAA